MASMHDIVIRGGTIMDGNGGTPFIGDVAIKDGKIEAVGAVSGSGREEIDAEGLSVTPGFVDIHTHYDGQAMWDFSLGAIVLARRNYSGHGQLWCRLCAGAQGYAGGRGCADGRG